MRYISTRGQSPPVSFLDAVLAGMAPDGGLYVPDEWPTLPEEAPQGSYADCAARVLKLFAGDELSDAAVGGLCNAAYRASAWEDEEVAPLVQIGLGEFALELFHGPSLSFKDVAMQFIGPLYEYGLSQRDQRLTVICATSGDTGGAAVEALKGRDRVDLFVLAPKGRVSEVQRLFMTTSGAANVHAIEIDGDFDACQGILKALFSDTDFAGRASLSAVNSVNWARIAAQCVYYWVACYYWDASPKESTFVVPTGNFGDAFSGYVAKRMGAPISKIVLATNRNDLLTRAVNSGRYERAAHSHATLSPAMDIQVASNFERVLFEATNRDGESVRRLYEEFAQKGGFDIPRAALTFLRQHFVSATVNDDETLQALRDTWEEAGYVACPHTAVGFRALEKIEGEGVYPPVVDLATAHPAKFADTVERATGVRPQLPPRCADLFEREEKFDSLPADVEAVKRYIRERSRAWQ